MVTKRSVTGKFGTPTKRFAKGRTPAEVQKQPELTAEQKEKEREKQLELERIQRGKEAVKVIEQKVKELEEARKGQSPETKTRINERILSLNQVKGQALSGKFDGKSLIRFAISKADAPLLRQEAKVRETARDVAVVKKEEGFKTNLEARNFIRNIKSKIEKKTLTVEEAKKLKPKIRKALDITITKEKPTPQPKLNRDQILQRLVDENPQIIGRTIDGRLITDKADVLTPTSFTDEGVEFTVQTQGERIEKARQKLTFKVDAVKEGAKEIKTKLVEAGEVVFDFGQKVLPPKQVEKVRTKLIDVGREVNTFGNQVVSKIDKDTTKKVEDFSKGVLASQFVLASEFAIGTSVPDTLLNTPTVPDINLRAKTGEPVTRLKTVTEFARDLGDTLEAPRKFLGQGIEEATSGFEIVIPPTPKPLIRDFEFFTAKNIFEKRPTREVEATTIKIPAVDFNIPSTVTSSLAGRPRDPVNITGKGLGTTTELGVFAITSPKVLAVEFATLGVSGTGDLSNPDLAFEKRLKGGVDAILGTTGVALTSQLDIKKLRTVKLKTPKTIPKIKTEAVALEGLISRQRIILFKGSVTKKIPPEKTFTFDDDFLFKGNVGKVITESSTKGIGDLGGGGIGGTIDIVKGGGTATGRTSVGILGKGEVVGGIAFGRVRRLPILEQKITIAGKQRSTKIFEIGGKISDEPIFISSKLITPTERRLISELNVNTDKFLTGEVFAIKRATVFKKSANIFRDELFKIQKISNKRAFVGRDINLFRKEKFVGVSKSFLKIESPKEFGLRGIDIRFSKTASVDITVPRLRGLRKDTPIDIVFGKETVRKVRPLPRDPLVTFDDIDKGFRSLGTGGKGKRKPFRDSPDVQSVISSLKEPTKKVPLTFKEDSQVKALLTAQLNLAKLPRAVGGGGKGVSQFAGKGKFERTLGGLLPSDRTTLRASLTGGRPLADVKIDSILTGGRVGNLGKTTSPSLKSELDLDLKKKTRLDLLPKFKVGIKEEVIPITRINQRLTPRLKTSSKTKLSTRARLKLKSRTPIPRINLRLRPPPKPPRITKLILPFPQIDIEGKRKKRKKGRRAFRDDIALVEGFSSRIAGLKPIKIPRAELGKASLRFQTAGIRRRPVIVNSKQKRKKGGKR